MKHGALVVVLAALVLFAGNALAQQRATVVKADDLKAEPFRDARTVGALKKGQVITVQRRQGGWLEVRAGPASGWVLALSVRTGASVADAASGLAGLSTGRVVTGQIVQATGVRGTDTAPPQAVPTDDRGAAQAVPADDRGAAQAGAAPRGPEDPGASGMPSPRDMERQFRAYREQMELEHRAGARR